jgi:nitroimidazol reductase NimA-like FMN-containing flavoprotein (pyridoxamine 5'-phosphate oxidase superfamily)
VTTDGGHTPLSPSERTRLRRYPMRGRTDRAELYEFLDSALVAFVGGIVDGYPRVLPMVYGRIDDTLYLHGSKVNPVLLSAERGSEICVSVLTIQGLVLANSLFHHSVNFRSAMIYGTPRVVADEDERLLAMRASANQMIRGRADVLPDPTPKQLAMTLVVALPLTEASLKVREGAPNGDKEDYETDIWAGVLPLVQTWGEPVADAKLREAFAVPEHVARLAGQPAA